MKHFYSTTYWLLALCFWISVPLVAQAQCPVAASCTPGAASSPNAGVFGMGILNVTIGTINNTTTGVLDGYQNYSCTIGTTLSPGLTYPVSIQTNAGTRENVRVWIDYNNDGSFNPTTELFFSSDNAFQHTGTSLPVPANALPNLPLRMRVSADANNSPFPTPCSTPQFSQVEDYRVTMQANLQPPLAAFAVGTAGACAGAFTFQDQSSQGPTSWEWTFGDGTTSTQQHPSHTYAQPGTYTVQLRACNANGCDSLLRAAAVTFYGGGAPTPASCQPATTSYCCGYGITRFDFGALSQSSADASAGYEDFSCTRRLTVTPNQPIPFKVYTGTSIQHTWLYVDANNDGTFAASEQVYAALGQINPEGFFQVPTGALTGQPLRLRIISDDVNSTSSPCAARYRGQVEDYSLLVTPAPTCPATLRGGTIIPAFSQPSNASLDALAMVLSNYSPGAHIQWQKTPNRPVFVWRDIAGATLPAYYTTRTALHDTLYRAVVSCGPNSVPSTNEIDGDYRNHSDLHPSCSANYISQVSISGTTLATQTTCNNALGEGYWLFDPTKPSQTANLQYGETYQLNVTTTQSCRLTVFMGRQAQQLLPLVSIPSTTAGVSNVIRFTLDTLRVRTTTGALHIRIRCDRQTNQPSVTPTSYLTSGETEDYLLPLVRPFCSDPVVSGTVTAPTTPQCSKDAITLSVFGQTHGGQLQWQSSPDSLSWQDVTGQTKRELITRIPGPTFFRVRVQGCTSVAYTVPVKVLWRPLAECYCAAPAGNTSGRLTLTRVRLAGTTLDNASTATVGPLVVKYAPTVPTQTATLVRGATYALEVDVTSPAAGNQPVTLAAWLDIDQSATYDSLEWLHLVRQPTVAAGTTTYRVELPISQLAQLGPQGLRLRVGTEAFWTGNACARAVSSGESEEYMVTVVDAPCLGTLTAGTIYWPAPTTECLMPLQARGYSLGARLQWQRSSDQGGTWRDISGATTDRYLDAFVTRLNPEQVRVRAQCGGGTAYSPVVTLPQSNGLCNNCLGAYPSQSAGAGSIYIDEVALAGTTLANYGSGLLSQPQASHEHTRFDWQLPQWRATVVRGRSYPLQTTVVTQSTPAGSGGVWVDWDHDADLAVAEYTGPIAAPLGRATTTLTLTVPPTAALGTTLLRVRVVEQLLLPPSNACGYVDTYYNMENEDYLLTVVDQAGPLLPTLTASLCTGLPLRLEASGAGPGTIYTWTGPNNFQATGAVATRASFTAADAGTYVVQAELNGQRIATSVYVPPAPPCLPMATRPASLAGTLSVYPSPTTGLCVLRLPAEPLRPTQIRVRAATGQLVHEQPVAARTTAGSEAVEVPLDLRQLPHGLYFVELQTAEGRVFGKVILE